MFYLRLTSTRRQRLLFRRPWPALLCRSTRTRSRKRSTGTRSRLQAPHPRARCALHSGKIGRPFMSCLEILFPFSFIITDNVQEISSVNIYFHFHIFLQSHKRKQRSWIFSGNDLDEATHAFINVRPWEWMEVQIYCLAIKVVERNHLYVLLYTVQDCLIDNVLGPRGPLLSTPPSATHPSALKP